MPPHNPFHRSGAPAGDVSSARRNCQSSDRADGVRTPGPGGANPLTQADALGHEIQIDDLGGGTPAGQGIHRTGAIYGLQAPTAFPARPPGEWNTYLIETAGPKIKVTLNGVLVNDYTSTRQQNGFLALQVHSFPSKIQFRNLQVK